jgi:hypothetical protein
VGLSIGLTSASISLIYGGVLAFDNSSHQRFLTLSTVVAMIANRARNKQRDVFVIEGSDCRCSAIVRMRRCTDKLKCGESTF